MTLGEKLYTLRAKRNMTQEQLAEKLDISRQHLGAVGAPNIVRSISLDLLFNIADALEIDVRKLLDFHGNS